jgi:hypothetical protein
VFLTLCLLAAVDQVAVRIIRTPVVAVREDI